MKLMDRIRKKPHHPADGRTVDDELKKEEEKQKALEAQRQLQDAAMRDRPLL